ncbi:helix-turn-helix domain-containing protein [Nocardia callitridis]|uniref:HTH merR-type domain-containing protein n=1 Tax=Nocardia callitridis TaxID=648753 RepID=A0ABP9KC04_9NOCA
MSELTPIATVVRHFDIPLSTLHYWERLGLITAHRRSGRRCYDSDQLYRIALIRRWQTTGLLSLAEITALLNPRTPTANREDWRATVTARIAGIEHQMAELAQARAYLGQLLTCHTREDRLEDCAGYRDTVTLPH